MRALKSIYNFLCGDPFILVFTPLAFVVSGVLLSLGHVRSLVVLPVFVGFIIGGLLLALKKERS